MPSAFSNWIYPAGNGRLLWVPTPDMWRVHDAATPAAILRRANLHPQNWDSWQRRYFAEHPWLPNWLYNAASLADRTALVPTDAMAAFRREAMQESIAAAVARSGETAAGRRHPNRSEHVSSHLIQAWRQTLRARPEFRAWIDGWFLRGEEPPAAVVVASADQVERCSLAWDYVRLCERVWVWSAGELQEGITHFNTYRRWIQRGVIPDIQWLKWLYGWPAPGFVVTEPLERLRAERSTPAIARAAGLGVETACRFLRDPELGRIMEEAKSAAEQRGRNREGIPSFLAAYRLRADRARNIWDYARAATMPASCERAGVSNLAEHVREAREWRVETTLMDYLNHEGQFAFGNGGVLPSGLIVPQFFIPPPAMLPYRAVARHEMSRLSVWQLRDLPGFDAWFVDWTTPRTTQDRRKLPAGMREAARGAVAAPPIAVPAGLNETERMLVECVQDRGPIIGELIAAALGFPYGSYLRQTLSNLVKRGLLRRHPEGGYAVCEQG
jgi:hypothetical protein